MQNKRIYYSWILVVVFFLGSFLRIYQLGEESLWNDETFTWFFTRLPWAEMIDTVRLDGETPPVFYSANKAVTDLYGDSEAALRLLSATAGVVTLYIAWLLGRFVGGTIGGLASIWFMAFHPMAIIYARDARPYGLVLALATAYVYIFYRLREENKRKLWVSAFVILLLGQVTQYFFFGLGGVLLLVIISEINRQPMIFRRWMMVWIAAFLPLAGWLAWYFEQPTPSLGIGWIRTPEVVDLIGTWWNLLSGYGGEINIISSIFGALSLGFLGFAIWPFSKNGTNVKILLLTVILPILVVLIISQRRPIYVDRYFIIFLPLLAAFIAMGANKLSIWLNRSIENANIEKIIKYSLIGTLLFSGFWNGWQTHIDGKFAREDWRAMVEYLVNHIDENSLVWLSEYEAPVPFSYYYREDLTNVSAGGDPILCTEPCWWILRQPYSDTHAFSQSIRTDGRPSYPDLPKECNLLDSWGGTTGLALWQIQCADTLR